jgi:hypothetical protein
MGFFGRIFISQKDNSKTSAVNALHLWEDDYLMIELLPNENLDFLKKETKRIQNFGNEHIDGQGYSEITVVGDKPVKTIEKLIDINEMQSIVINSGLKKVEKFHMQGVGILKEDKAPIGYGNNRFAVILNKNGSLLEDIWLTGKIEGNEDLNKLKKVLSDINQVYGFIGVNWYRSEYYQFLDEQNIEEFIKQSC